MTLDFFEFGTFAFVLAASLGEGGTPWPPSLLHRLGGVLSLEGQCRGMTEGLILMDLHLVSTSIADRRDILIEKWGENDSLIIREVNLGVLSYFWLDNYPL